MSVQPFTAKHIVRGYDCNYGGPFRPLSLANYFQEAAGDHAFALSVGMNAMFSLGRTWMLSRIDIKIEELPKSGDEVVVRTWPAGTDRIFALRYLELLSADGRRLAGALYDYFIVDMEKRRPLRPERILDPEMKGDLPAPYPDLSPGFQNFPAFPGETPEDWTESFRVKASPRHIDYNGHVNNGHFIDWLSDAVPLDERSTGRIARIKVDFVSEVKLGEDVSALWTADRTSSGKYSLLLRGGDIVARALTLWS